MIPIIAQGFLGIEIFNPPWDVFFLPLFNLLIFLYELPVLDFALAIIVFTIIIRTILAPLFIRQIRSQKEMQRMQPLIREVQRKHKGNRQKSPRRRWRCTRSTASTRPRAASRSCCSCRSCSPSTRPSSGPSGTVTLSAEQVSSEAFRTLNAAVDITPLAQADTYLAPVNGACNLPEYSQLPQLLPLNCQLITPIKLDAPRRHHGRPGCSGLDLAQVDAVFAIPLFGGFALSLLAVIAAILQFVQVKMTSPRPNPEDPDLRDDEHDDRTRSPCSRSSGAASSRAV